MSDELKPCPFCGSIVIAHPHGEVGYICCHCGSEVFGEWNIRPLEDALRAELEAARVRIEALERVLRWYSNGFNYIPNVPHEDGRFTTPVLDDDGLRAKQVLNPSSKPPHD